MTRLSQSMDTRERPQEALADQARTPAQGRLPPKSKPELPPPPSVVPSNLGDIALKANGQVDWERMPQRPAYLPVNAEFNVTVVHGRWMVEVKQPKAI